MVLRVPMVLKVLVLGVPMVLRVLVLGVPIVLKAAEHPHLWHGHS